jgi:hypothetical protein
MERSLWSTTYTSTCEAAYLRCARSRVKDLPGLVRNVAHVEDGDGCLGCIPLAQVYAKLKVM